jgi:hypothetical protein
VNSINSEVAMAKSRKLDSLQDGFVFPVKKAMPGKNELFQEESGKDAGYNGLTIIELTEKILKFADEIGARYDSIYWNGSARVSLTTSDYEHVLSFFSGMRDLSEQWQFNVSISGCFCGSVIKKKIMNGDGNMRIDFTVPGRLKTQFG